MSLESNNGGVFMSLDDYFKLKKQLKENSNDFSSTMKIVSQMPSHFREEICNSYLQFRNEHPVLDIMMRIPPFKYMFFDKEMRKIIYK